MWSNSKYKGSNSSDGWTQQRINKLVCLYEKHKCLWKKDDSFYLDCKQRHNAYKSICKHLSTIKITFIQVLIKIQEIRKLYIQELKKIFYAQYNGCHYEPNFPWFWRLHQFLHPYLDHEESLQLHKALSNSACEQEHRVRLQSRNRRKKLGKSSKRSTKRVVKEINEKGGITSDRNSSLNCQLSDSCPKTWDLNKVSNCFTNFRIASCSNKAVSISENETASHKTYILKNKEPQIKYERNTCESVSKTESRNQSDISCLTVRKPCDQFDFFAKTVACQLRKMNMNFALKAQKAIQKILQNSDGPEESPT